MKTGIRTISYGRQWLDEADKRAVLEVLEGDWLTQGPTVERFESAVAECVGARFGVSFSSASAALHASAWALGLGPGDKGVTSPLTFIASTNAFRHVGATPALVDISPQTWNLDLRQVGPDARALMPVHFAGLPVNLGDWKDRQTDQVVIEDASHALGAMTPDGPVGNCVHSDITCFSFHPVKPITTGEGGMATTNDGELADRMRRFRNHGIRRKTGEDDWLYDAEAVGFNYRLSDIHAALGLSQLNKLEAFIRRRNEIAATYRERLTPELIEMPPQAAESFLHGYHLFPILVRDRRRFIMQLREKGIMCQVHYVPAHHHSVNSDLNINERDLPVVEKISQEIVSLPIHPGLSSGALDYVIEAVNVAVATIGEDQRS